MTNQAIFSSTDKSKQLKCRLLQLLFSALRVNMFSRLLNVIILICSHTVKQLVHQLHCTTCIGKGIIGNNITANALLSSIIIIENKYL